MEVVIDDPFEIKGTREYLNLGHTIGHALEGSSKGKLSHGEAVSIGLVAAVKLSKYLNYLTDDKEKYILKTIRSLDLPDTVSKIKLNTIIKMLKFDKKGGNFILVKDIGNLIRKDNIPINVIIKVLNEILI